MGKVKKKCCRSTPKRCQSCAVVAPRLAKIEKRGLRVRRAVKAARVY